MTELEYKFRLKSTDINEASLILFEPKEFVNSFSDAFEISDLNLEGVLEPGYSLSLTLKKFGFSAPCKYKVTECSPTKLIYIQTQGVMRKWTHEMEISEGKRGLELKDRISYEVPYGILGHLANDLYLRSEIESMLFKRLKKLKLK